MKTEKKGRGKKEEANGITLGSRGAMSWGFER